MLVIFTNSIFTGFTRSKHSQFFHSCFFFYYHFHSIITKNNHKYMYLLSFYLFVLLYFCNFYLIYILYKTSSNILFYQLMLKTIFIIILIPHLFLMTTLSSITDSLQFIIIIFFDLNSIKIPLRIKMPSL